MSLADWLLRRKKSCGEEADYVGHHLHMEGERWVYRGKLSNNYVMWVIDAFAEVAAQNEQVRLTIQDDGRATEDELQEMETYMDGSPYRNRMRYVAWTDSDRLK